MGKPNDLVQGTLDLLILKIISLEPKHGWAIAKRIQQVSKEALQVQQGSLYPALYGSNTKRGLRPNGRKRKPDGPRIITLYRPPAASSLRRNWQAGADCQARSTLWCAPLSEVVCGGWIRFA